MRSTLSLAAGVLGLLLCAAGAVVFTLATRGGTTTDAGWTAYTPLGPTDLAAYRSVLTLNFSDRWTMLWTGGHLLGAALAVVGLLLLAGVGGWALGRRSARSSG